MRRVKYKYLITLLLILGGLAWITNQAFLYSSDTTHPYLTEQIVKFYNYYYEPDISREQLEKMKQGSTHEDFGDRSWFYHFYDPIYNKGTGKLTAKQWAQSPEAQAGFPGGDHSWQTAINNYNAGYKQEAFYSLGHILHLIEDMAVPAHTRNDAHQNGDPLEKWAGNLPYDSNFYNIADPLYKNGIKPKIFNNLNAYFDEVANFSNRNFFSKDSINDTIDTSTGQPIPSAKYAGPKIVKEAWENGKKYGYGKVEGSSRLIHLLRIKTEDGKNVYFLDGTTPEIHVDYFSILSKQAVINGAGVIKLFFDNITEPAKEITEPEKQLSFWQKIGNSVVGGVNFLISAVDGLIHTPSSAIESVIEESTPPAEYLTTGPVTLEGVIENLRREEGPETLVETPETMNDTEEARPQENQVPPQEEPENDAEEQQNENGPIIVQGPKTGGNGDVGISEKLLEEINNPPQSPVNPQQVEQEEQYPQEEEEQEGGEQQQVVEVEAEEEESEEASVSYTIINQHISEDTVWSTENSPYLVYAPGGGSQELLEIAEGVTLTIEPGVIVKFVNPGLKVYGTIKAGGTAENPIVFTDYNDREYAGAIFGSTASSQAGAWSGIWITESSTDSVFDNIILRYAGSRTRPFRTGSTYSSAAVGAGIKVENTSIILKNSTIENNVFKGIWLINSPDTIIENSIFRNHLEYDNSYTTLAAPTELRNMALYIDSSSIKIKNSTFQNNLTGIFIFNSSGPVIENNNFSNNSRPILVYNSYPQFSNNQIEGNQWDGIVVKALKLDRDYTLGGGLASPPGGSVFINYDYPYNSIIVSEGYTLTIEPGTIIKSMDSTSGLKIEGTLTAEGTAENPIIFTSFYDDEYGGDTNGDGDWVEYCRTKDPADNTYLNCPKAGFWGQIVFTSTSTDSSLNYVIIRYGGTKWGECYNYQPDYVLKVENTDVAIANSIFENNTSGAYLENSSSQLANNTFRDHRYSRPFSSFTSTGIYLSSSRPTIDTATFLNNSLGIYIDPASWLDLVGLVFENNNEDFKDMRPQE